jgi:hypothetical protein
MKRSSQRIKWRKTFQGKRKHPQRAPISWNSHGYHIFSHPDFNRRPWLFTKSADLAKSQALAGLSMNELTAGGEFRPALKT